MSSSYNHAVEAVAKQDTLRRMLEGPCILLFAADKTFLGMEDPFYCDIMSVMAVPSADMDSDRMGQAITPRLVNGRSSLKVKTNFRRLLSGKEEAMEIVETMPDTKAHTSRAFSESFDSFWVSAASLIAHDPILVPRYGRPFMLRLPANATLLHMRNRVVGISIGGKQAEWPRAVETWVVGRDGSPKRVEVRGEIEAWPCVSNVYLISEVKSVASCSGDYMISSCSALWLLLKGCEQES